MHTREHWLSTFALAVAVLSDIAKAYPPSYHRHIRTHRADSAWNGQVTSGSDTTQAKKVPFTPYWVPFGASSIDDNDALHVTYSPSSAWSVEAGTGYVGGTTHRSIEQGAEATLKFRGASIEWYGPTSPDGGTAEVYLDGHSISAVSLRYGTRAQTQQMIFRKDGLATGEEHVLKIINISDDGKANKVDIDAFVVQHVVGGRRRSLALSQLRQRMERRKRVPMSTRLEKRLKTPSDGGWAGTTRLAETGNSGVNAMQLAVFSDTHALLIDKVEHNLLSIDGHPAWAAMYDFASSGSSKARPLDISSNSFCAGGSWLSNGTLINVGGNPVTKDHTGSADFGDVNGLQAIRMLHPCEGDDCKLYEEPERIRMATARWYASVARLSDGSALIMGGSTKGGWINNRTTNNPTIEYFPPKNIQGSLGLPIHSSFLDQTLNANLFPIVFTLPNDLIFVAANTGAMLYSWKDNTQHRLPDIPNGVHVTYPMSAGATLLPLTKENGYTPEVLICGGSTIDDTRPSTEISSQEAASDQCVRMVLSEEGIKKGWQVERMPEARHMPDLVMMPGGEVLIVNGAQTGVGGYGNVKNQVGQSNADHPAFTPVLYRPGAPEGQRFSRDGMPASKIARMYHSVASLLPSGEVLIAGSNPNLDRTAVEYPTEYRVETLSPPYMEKQRPVFNDFPANLEYGKPFSLNVALPAGTSLQDIKVSLIDLGFVTHAIHMNTRLVSLVPAFLSADGRTLSVEGPPSEQIYPPGPGWLYVLVNGIPSEGKKFMVGTGADPPLDEEAIQNVLAHTEAIAYKKPAKAKQPK